MPHIHFDGAGGNIGAGKCNDGSPENRQVLADRVAAGMARAWEATEKTPIAAADLGWEAVAVALPPTPHLDEGRLRAVLDDITAGVPEVVEVLGLSGPTDLLVQVVARDADDLYRIAGQLLATEGVERTNTSLVMRRLVEHRLSPLLQRLAGRGDRSPALRARSS